MTNALMKLFKSKKRRHPQEGLPTIATPIPMKLNEHELWFESGDWKAEPRDPQDVQSEILRLRKENKELKDQNRLLEFKNQLLLDMLTAASLDADMLDQELSQVQASRQRTAPSAAAGPS